MEQRCGVTEGNVGYWMGQENVGGRKMGYRRVVLLSYFPALPIFLPAGRPAFDSQGGLLIRASCCFVSVRAMLVADLGKKMKGKKIGHRRAFPVSRCFCEPSFCQLAVRGRVEMSDRRVDGAAV